MRGVTAGRTTGPSGGRKEKSVVSKLPSLLVILTAVVVLPAASRIVTVTETAAVGAAITVLTEAVAIKETGPAATVARFGEVYAFSPAFVAVHRDEPTEISFWNLQADDEHDFMLVAPDSQV